MSNIIQGVIDNVGDYFGLSKYARTTKCLDKWIKDHDVTRPLYNANKCDIIEMVTPYQKSMKRYEWKYDVVAPYIDNDGSFKQRVESEALELTMNVRNRLKTLTV